MEGRLVLKNCSIFRSDGRVRSRMAVLIEGGRIAQIAPDEQLPVLPGDWEVPCRGRLVAPGLVDCHTHLVGGQLLPLSGELLLRSSRSRFELQHRLDERLTASEVEVLSAFAVARALRHGVTLVVEHLHAPGDVAGALAAQTRVAERLGVRLVNSHATTSVLGGTPPLAQLEANAEHARNVRTHERVRAALGFWASSSCDDELLRRVGRLREELGVGAHFHLAETEEDLTTTYSLYGKRIVPRLEAFGLLGAGAVGAFANAVDSGELERLARSRTLVALSPRLTSLTDPRGSAGEAVLAQQGLNGLGTLGCSSLWEELQGAFVGVMAVARVGRLLDPDGALAQLLVSGPAELCSMLFAAPSGTVEEGSLADLVVYSHVPADEATGALAPHLLLLLGQAPVAWTLVGGRVVVREGELIGADELELGREAGRVLRSLWGRASEGAGAARDS